MQRVADLIHKDEDAIKERFRNIQLIGADPATAKGFTQVPNFILSKNKLSTGAKLAYACLLKYYWYDQAVFPGQAKLAEDMGCSERSVRTYLTELESAGLLKVRQRGLNKTNEYDLYFTVKKQGK